MADNITLSSAMRTNLLTLQKTGANVDRTNSRLSTGLRVSSAIDDAVNYFQAKGLSERANDLNGRKENIDQAISSVKTAIGGLEAVEKILVQMKGVALSGKSATGAERADLMAQFNTLAQQMNHLADDTSFQGLNLVNSTAATLKIQFSEKTAAELTVTGVEARFSVMKGVDTIFAAAASVAASAVGVMTGGWSVLSDEDASDVASSFNEVIKAMDSAIAGVRSNAKSLGSNVALLQTRLDFTKQYSNTLTEGAGKLTLADLNEEGANLVSLQTRQQLGIQALSFAGQQEQGVLALFR